MTRAESRALGRAIICEASTYGNAARIEMTRDKYSEQAAFVITNTILNAGQAAAPTSALRRLHDISAVTAVSRRGIGVRMPPFPPRAR
jgi:predicted metal-dependent RNase